MKVIILGATGMVGQGVLRECLLDPGIEAVLTVGRSAAGLQHKKLKEIIHNNFKDLSDIEDNLPGYDACFFCLGVSSVGMKEEDYLRVTYDITMTVAHTLVKLNPEMIFIYVSGASTDSSEKGRVMWARVKGKTENSLLRLPFKAAYMFRPGYIQPLHGVVSKTKLYRVLYAGLGVLYPILKRLFPNYVTTTEALGRAMIRVAKEGAPGSIIESKDIFSIAQQRI
ncbi:NAD-dependent epimerase/dehydratase family protein [Desulfosporosinus sp. PR]|uniref:NAD-dependent epimerase/dehydratase family protein n=1 Tax=Candidatus Desulfosporosinus nitrosoreducens TaxID=3401928 RepID=UPI0027F4CC57|nr:NAD-dependent epimerase/dehydratase family protein [Desulfosporosinus sp. PR]MDQ7093254.1 NAD-dependent epimerase/dehydratase family protein [Desulfosporosinus sp. PR]